MHDDTINRTCCNATDGTAISEDIPISTVTYDDLIVNYDACTPSQWTTWKGIKVPTFEEFMACCRVMNLHPWIELKRTHAYTIEEIRSIISTIKKCGMEQHVSFISFSYNILALVKDEWDSVELGLNGAVADAERLKTGKNRVFMIYDYSSSNYADAINAGFQLCFYTVNTENALTTINTSAYDSILTNTLLPSQVNDVVRSKYEASI
jgi:glycerophosphoryl diester phosphodiesterase